ncbi:putative hydrolase [Sphingobium sp. SYK-6]|uniref:amidohydrolase family protein n=1 Tax=Sphingobium sp. (strain NBRC 103272 / SYK-6) TaxID=627192 RepID=UPI000227759D|nr:amidohydrolase family protein [Sphingobium sp. SYK-6]BAK67805.1 putative hydrolase [Sphingobium sp. SYK-6]
MMPALPAGACDAHCHIFGPASVYSYDPARSYTPEDAPREALFELHRSLGIDRAVLVQPNAHGFDHRAMIDAIATSGGRYRGVALVPFDIEDQALDILDRKGIRGIRYNFLPHLSPPPPLDAFRDMMKRIERLGWHVVLHVGGADLPGLQPYLEGLSVPAVIDHLGRIEASAGLDQKPFRALLDFARRPDVWIKISGCDRASAAGAPWRDVIPFVRRIVDAAPDRILWGTDWPHPNIKGPVPDDLALLELCHEILGGDGLLRAVLVDNPARLYRFDNECEASRL